MPIEVVMPKFGLTMQEGTIQQWFKAEGESIAAGQPLFEVETEKVLYQVEAPASGVVAKLLYPAEATAPCARVVAVIAQPGEDPLAIAANYASATPAPIVPAPSARGTASAPPAAPNRTPAATPVARKLAKEHGLDLAAIQGSGPGGRITREDVEAAISAPRSAAAAAQPLKGMRKNIAERMLKSLHSSAQLTITTEADVTAMVRRHAELKAQFALTYTDLIIEAVAGALRSHPRLGVTVAGDAIQSHTDINIGIAVALDDGLIAPVIRKADQKSLPQIAEQTRLLAGKARAGTLGVEEVSGGTFTITNLGMYGVDAFTPIINQPQVAILGVGRVVEKPAVFDGQIAIRSLLTLSLTFDHRIVDGAPAAAFLRAVVERLSN
ncbi:MAG: 2-oxo acid dehydrogenase subunit E2 [Deltaproteobacteria bacterium]|nr:2-oxo acid dehydrogenase subunit E2 [Deltaproteobacteria bacterium]